MELSITEKKVVVEKDARSQLRSLLEAVGVAWKSRTIAKRGVEWRMMVEGWV